jgi:hypothetical protein
MTKLFCAPHPSGAFLFLHVHAAAHFLEAAAFGGAVQYDPAHRERTTIPHSPSSYGIVTGRQPVQGDRRPVHTAIHPNVTINLECETAG